MSFWGKKGRVTGIIGLSTAAVLLLGGSASMFSGTLMTNVSTKTWVLQAPPAQPPGAAVVNDASQSTPPSTPPAQPASGIKVSVDTAQWVKDFNSWNARINSYATGFVFGQMNQKPGKIETRIGLGAFNFSHLYAPTFISDKGSRIDVDEPPKASTQVWAEITKLHSENKLYEKLKGGGGKVNVVEAQLNPSVTFPPYIFAKNYDEFRKLVNDSDESEIKDKTNTSYLLMVIGSSIMGLSVVVFISALMIFVINNNKSLHMEPEKKGGKQ